MEKFIDRLIRQFESGALGRREFCQMLGIAAAITAAGGAEANAAPAGRGFKGLGVNHISYVCPDYTKARDFYSSMFGMQVVNDKGKGRANLAFGPAPDKGGNFLVVHNPGANPPKPSEAIIDHVAYTISNWDEGKVRGALKAKGFDKPTGRDGSLHVYDPFDYDVQIANAVQENAFRRGA
jgi:catechol 2,3-dioxygenase-like lactoylglutathione lyase family enzyme